VFKQLAAGYMPTASAAAAAAAAAALLTR